MQTHKHPIGEVYMIPARVVKSLTGLSKSQIKKLTPFFSVAWNNADIQKGLHSNPNRPGRPSKLEHRSVLIFVLAYLKTDASFDALSFTFKVNRSTFYYLVRRGLHSLEAALEEIGVMPLRDIKSPLELLAILRGKKDVFLDVTERPIRRPKTMQRVFYSGKKKQHTVKNQILCDENKEIIALGDTIPGSAHDFEILKHSRLKSSIPKSVRIHVDLAYYGLEGICPDTKISIPDKKPKNNELNPSQKKITNKNLLSELKSNMLLEE